MPVIREEDDSPERRPQHKLKFRRLPGLFAVCQLPADALVPGWAASGRFVSITRSEDELSIVCPGDNVPAGPAGNVKAEHGWMCFKLEGPFPFAQTGVLASFIDPLAEQGVPIFAISTYDTDYVLVQESHAGVALATLRGAGHELWPQGDSRRKVIE
jgi:uncharacterized protein